MVKYIRIVVLGLVTAISVGTVGAMSYSKYAELEVKQYKEAPYEFASPKDRDRQLKCMADNIYYEAGSESVTGKIAVAQVVMNRVAHPSFPKDPCRVIYQKNVFYDKVVCQFSWYCDSSTRRRSVNTELWNEGYNAAIKVMLEGFRLPDLQDALYYHADYVNPRWGKPQVAKIGRHIFFK